MTKSNIILLKSLLNLEFELGKTQKILENNTLFFSLSFDFTHIYDLFETIISAFNILPNNYDYLYDLLQNLYSNSISVNEVLESIELMTSNNN